jgi:hypothetical protein
MLLYEDIITGDELFSDAFPLYVHRSLPKMGRLLLPPRKEVEDIVYEVDCQMIVVKAGADIDIGQKSFISLELRRLSHPL